MPELKFDESLCETCETHACLTRCQYMDFDLEQAREERRKLNNGEDSRALTDCVTCYACEEYCPNGNHPFYQLVELQEAKGFHPVPKPIEKQQVRMMKPMGKIEQLDLRSPVINMCAFGMFEKFSIQGQLFEGVSTFAGNDIFCNLMYLHFAKNSVIKERVPNSIQNIRKYYLDPNKTDEFVCFHDECYGTYKSWAPAFGIEVPFKPVHLFDFLLQRLKERKGDITPLNMKVAYQRPCSSRLIPDTRHLVDEVFEVIGVERAKRKYDHENALCCGGVILAHGKDDLVEDVQKRNIDDMKEAGATACVFNCQFCFIAMGEMIAKNGMMPLLMSDLCRLALGEQLKGWEE